MIKHIEQCSKCKAYVNGEAQRELSRKLITKVSHPNKQIEK